MTAHLDAGDVPDTRNLGLILGHGAASAELLNLFFARIGDLVGRIGRFGGSGSNGHLLGVDLRLIVAFRGTSADLWRKHGNATVAASTVLLATNEGRANGFGCIT